MKSLYKKVLVLAILTIGISSCSPEDPIESTITNYATFEILGDQYTFIQQDEMFEDPGVVAKSGNETLEVEVSGSVDTSTPGVYQITYSATNSDGFPASIIRYVAVGDKTTASARDLSGTYLAGNGGKNEVSKIADGFYMNTDAFPTNKLAVFMVDIGNGSLLMPTQSSPFGPVICDPNIVPGTGGTIDSDTSFTLNLGIQGSIYSVTFTKQ